MEFDFNVPKCCKCNSNGYGHLSISDLDQSNSFTGGIEFPGLITKVKAAMNRASYRSQGKYFDKETAKQLFSNPIEDYLEWK